MTTAEPIEAVVFDWDGTLMDSKAALLASYHQVTTELLGAPYPTEQADIDQIVQLRGKESFAIIAKGDEELFERVSEAFHEAYTANQQMTEPFEGTMEMLEALRAAGIKIGVATSKARKRMVLEGERTGISALVDHSTTGDDVSAAKPDPEAVTRAIEALGVSPSRTLYVGDGPNDVIAGRDAGAVTVGVTFGFHPAEMLEESPTHVISDPRELIELAGVAAPSA